MMIGYSLKLINEWPDKYTPNCLFVTKLRNIEPALSDEQLWQVLQTIDNTCHACWDSENPCHCENAE